MGDDQYKEQFLSEARDYIDSINDDLLNFEKDPKNEDVIHNLFRSFHTLKGNASTMGYTKYSELAHHLEDLLDKIRNKQIEVNSDIVDVLFRGADALEQGLQVISDDDPDNVDDSLTEEITKLLQNSKGKQQEVQEDEGLSFSDEDNEKIKNAKENGKKVFRITLVFDEGNDLKGVKTLLLLRDLGNEGEILKTSPEKEKISSGQFKTHVYIIIASESEENIKKLAENVTSAVSNEVTELAEEELNGGSLEGKEKQQEQKGTAKDGSKESDKEKIAKQQQEAMTKQLQSVKIDIKSLDNLMDLVGELLINKVRLEQYAQESKDKEFTTLIDTLTRLTLDIQDEVMKQRMIPIGNIFNRFPRMVRDLAKKENKSINLNIEGQDIEFDRTVLDEIGDPLVHLLRNSVDHGIEAPEERKKEGKPENGTVMLTARKEKTNAIIEITDDGKGIDAQKVKESCIKKGVVTQEEADAMDEKELRRLIFRPGVSTSKKITEVSGRGVGMDVVETKIKKLGGNVKLDSKEGQGTTIKLQLPLTLAIVSSLIIRVDDSKYALPLSTIVRTVKIKHKDIRTIGGNEVFLLMNEDIPLVRLRNLLHGTPPKEQEYYTVIVVDKDDSKIGIVVDSIDAQQQVLIKNLDEMVKGIKGLGGATILGDGRVALILDIATLFD
ncbi:MAG: chemotaxis protein CheA [Candidatus Nanoarchaeia archaeon]